MKQVVQDLRTGKISLLDIPAPSVEPYNVVIQSQASILSAGTERMLLEFGRGGLIAKARQQPDKVRDVLRKAKTDGLPATIGAVRNKLDQPMPLGYCNAGRVVSVGSSVTTFKPGDLVSCNGPHAELVRVPQNLCALIPEGVEAESAAFAPLGAVALESLRLANPTLGECVVVSGLGLVGLLCVQLLLANGCRVIGVDKNPRRLKLAAKLGASTVHLDSDPLAHAHAETAGQGVDAVLVAVATDSSEPVRLAAQMCRTKGRIVLVGMSGLNLSRADFQAKELSFQISNSYGPGRYDPEYESGRLDYPSGLVRWTAKRNLDAFLSVLASGRVDVTPLISHRVPFARVEEAYTLLLEDNEALGILLEYPRVETAAVSSATVVLTDQPHARPRPVDANPVMDVIGAGNYAGQVLLPALKRTGIRLGTLASTGSVTSVHQARRFGFSQATSDLDALMAAGSENPVVIATRHDSHATLVCRALAARRHVFVEKPLAIEMADLDRIVAVREQARVNGHDPVLTVGFNRRFAPAVMELKRWLRNCRVPAAFVYTVNAGELPPDHWSLDPDVGGGRIVGEACHFIDLLRYLADSSMTGYSVSGTGDTAADRQQETAVINLRFENGSVGTIHYLANGSRSFPKERIEVFAAGNVVAIDNFRRVTGYGSGAPNRRFRRQDKGQNNCVQAFVNAVEGTQAAPVPFAELIEVSRVAILTQERLRQGDCNWHAVP